MQPTDLTIENDPIPTRVEHRFVRAHVCSILGRMRWVCLFVLVLACGDDDGPADAAIDATLDAPSTDAPSTDAPATDAGVEASVDANADDAPIVDGGLREVIFHSDWSTELGQSMDALLDTDKDVPWDGFIGNGRGNQVVEGSVLDFPSSNVLEVVGQWREDPAGALAQNVTLFIDEAHIPIPPVGTSLYYRWYIRVTVPDSYTADGSTHPIEDGPGMSDHNWNFLVDTNPDGTWDAILQTGANAFPDNRWACPTLDKGVTYRFEMQVHRISVTGFNLHARVYDSAGTLLHDDDDFRNARGTGDGTLADMPELITYDWSLIQGFQVGFNGLMGGTEEQFPFTLYYQGAIAIDDDDWLGPYRDGI